MVKSVITTAARTPIGSFQGSLQTFSASQLGATVIREVLRRSQLDPGLVDEVIMGCVLTAGLGQNPARQAALGGGLLNTTNCLTLNKVCSSGLRAVMLADQMIRAGDAEICIAGGMESMTNAPYLLPKARTGYRLGDGELLDSMIFDGLRDAYDGQHMGVHAEACVQEYGITREAQDAFAIGSYQRAQKATTEGLFRDEIVAVKIPQKKGDPLRIENDEEPSRVKFDKISQLKPVFSQGGTITAANASSISDGAAALLVMSEKKAQELKLTPLVSIVALGQAAREPAWYTTAPIKAIQNVLEKTGLTLDDIDLFEINEAFAVVVIAAMRELKLDPKRVNVNGGSVALGHPIGATGARLLTSMCYALQKRNKKRGLVSLCNGGGEATAMIVERISS